jgi:2-dehydro-3-deoxygluconokinase
LAAALFWIIKMSLNLKKSDDCRWDFVSLGEVLLRFCPQERRIRSAYSFDVYDGGGEYNVARNLSNCFGLQTAAATALADNELGRLAEGKMRQGGVDTSLILWREADGRGASTRNGIYFIERGFGLRSPSSCFDRANTAVSQLNSGEINWTQIFASHQTRWFHTGGIFAGLSETTAETAAAAMQAAQNNKTIVSYDLNYRDSLWRERGGRSAADAVNRELLKFADVVFGVFDFDSRLSQFNMGNFRHFCEQMNSAFPNLKIIASSLRDVHTANRHSVGGAVWIEGEIFCSQARADVEVYDRVGSGDAFASGLIYQILKGAGGQEAIECAAAAGVLAMTTAGDNLQVSAQEVFRLMRSNDANVNR